MTIEDNWGDLKILDISQDHGNVKDGTIDDYDYHDQHPSHHHQHPSHPHHLHITSPSSPGLADDNVPNGCPWL